MQDIQLFSAKYQISYLQDYRHSTYPYFYLISTQFTSYIIYSGCLLVFFFFYRIPVEHPAYTPMTIFEKKRKKKTIYKLQSESFG